MNTFQCTKCGCTLTQPTEPFRCPQCGSQGIGLFRAMGGNPSGGYGTNNPGMQPGFRPQQPGMGGGFQQNPGTYPQQGGGFQPQQPGMGGAYSQPGMPGGFGAQPQQPGMNGGFQRPVQPSGGFGAPQNAPFGGGIPGGGMQNRMPGGGIPGGAFRPQQGGFQSAPQGGFQPQNGGFGAQQMRGGFQQPQQPGMNSGFQQSTPGYGAQPQQNAGFGAPQPGMNGGFQQSAPGYGAQPQQNAGFGASQVQSPFGTPSQPQQNPGFGVQPGIQQNNTQNSIPQQSPMGMNGFGAQSQPQAQNPMYSQPQQGFAPQQVPPQVQTQAPVQPQTPPQQVPPQVQTQAPVQPQTPPQQVPPQVQTQTPVQPQTPPQQVPPQVQAQAPVQPQTPPAKPQPKVVPTPAPAPVQPSAPHPRPVQQRPAGTPSAPPAQRPAQPRPTAAPQQRPQAPVQQRPVQRPAKPAAEAPKQPAAAEQKGIRVRQVPQRPGAGAASERPRYRAPEPRPQIRPEIDRPERCFWGFPEQPPFTCDARPMRNAPVVDEKGRLVMVSQGKLFCLDITRPEPDIVWEYMIQSHVPGPVVVDSHGDYHLHAMDGYLHLVTKDGKQSYRPVQVGEPLGYAAPVVDGWGNTLISNYNGGLIRVNSQGQKDARPYFRSRAKLDSSGVIAGGILYIGSEDGYLFAIDLDDAGGRLLWDQGREVGYAGGFLNSSPAIGADGTIIVATRAERLIGFYATGEIAWTAYMPGQLLASPVVDAAGNIYVGASMSTRQGNRGYLVSVDGNTHKIRWQYETDDMIESTPCVGDDGTIYFGNNAGWLYALNSRGDKKWAAKFESGIRSAGTIAAPNLLTFALDDDVLVGVRCDSNELASSGWPKFGHDNFHSFIGPAIARSSSSSEESAASGAPEA